MALKDLLTSEGRLKFRIERSTKTLLERYAQSEARMEAAEKLKSIGTPEAIYGLVRRFSATSENLGIDQDEKIYIRDVLVSFGDQAVDPIKRYIRNYDKVTWAIQALEKIQPTNALVRYLFEILAEGDPVRIRGDKATQILKALETLNDPSVVEGVIPCLKSPDDTVRNAAVECLEAKADLRAREPLLETLTNPEEDSIRVRTRIAESLERLGWEVKGFRKKVETVLPEGFRITSKGRVTRG
jgi:HEAT repeat protein